MSTRARTSLLTLFMLVFVQPAYAKVTCPDYVDVDVISTPSFDEPHLNHTLGFKELDALRTTRTGLINPKSEGTINSVSGLTDMPVVVSPEINFQLLTSDTGIVCMQVMGVDLKIQTRDSMVYIAQEIPQDSCSYRAVFEHELKHVALTRSALQDAAPVLKTQFQDFLRPFGVTKTTVAQMETTKDSYNQAINNYVSALSIRLNTLLRKQQQEIDTPEEYKRVNDACDGELPTIARNTL